MTGESDKDNVFHPDYEYEIVKNINKKKSDSKNLKGVNFEIAPNVKRNTGYENTKAKNSPKASNDISLTNTKNRVRAKSTLLWTCSLIYSSIHAGKDIPANDRSVRSYDEYLWSNNWLITFVVYENNGRGIFFISTITEIEFKICGWGRKRKKILVLL